MSSGAAYRLVADTVGNAELTPYSTSTYTLVRRRGDLATAAAEGEQGQLGDAAAGAAAAGMVSVRVIAKQRNGGGISQTITRAFGLR
ncbi:hypothetical protein ACWGID_19610 [Kribbella sp. NPDC054772]